MSDVRGLDAWKMATPDDEGRPVRHQSHGCPVARLGYCGLCTYERLELESADTLPAPADESSDFGAPWRRVVSG